MKDRHSRVQSNNKFPRICTHVAEPNSGAGAEEGVGLVGPSIPLRVMNYKWTDKKSGFNHPTIFFPIQWNKLEIHSPSPVPPPPHPRTKTQRYLFNSKFKYPIHTWKMIVVEKADIFTM